MRDASFESVLSPEGDIDSGTLAGRHEQGLEALPMTYVLEVGNMLASYAEYKQAKIGGDKEAVSRSFGKFSEEANRVAGLRKMFTHKNDQTGFINAQREIMNLLNEQGLTVPVVDPEAVLEETIPDEDFVQRLIGSQAVNPYDKKILEILSEAEGKL